MDIKTKLNNYLNSFLEVQEESINLSRARTSSKAKTSSTGSSTYADFMIMRDDSITNYINQNKEEDTFQTKLFKYIDDKNLKDSDVYNKVDIDRRLFSKIRSDRNYHPKKDTIILLGIALELNEKEIEDLLDSASYSLPMNTTFDLIIRFCFKEKIYDLNQINEFLYDHNCRLLNE